MLGGCLISTVSAAVFFQYVESCSGMRPMRLKYRGGESLEERDGS